MCWLPTRALREAYFAGWNYEMYSEGRTSLWRVFVHMPGRPLPDMHMPAAECMATARMFRLKNPELFCAVWTYEHRWQNVFSRAQDFAIGHGARWSLLGDTVGPLQFAPGTIMNIGRALLEPWRIGHSDEVPVPKRYRSLRIFGCICAQASPMLS